MSAATWICATTIAVFACGKQEAGEQAFVANEIVELKAAIAARDESKVLVGCMSTKTGLARMPKAMVEDIERLCYVDAPRLFLENAVRGATDAKARAPGLENINCMQLMAEDAFKAIKAHPTSDPELQKLVDEYTRLCPDRVAKLRAR